MFIVKQKISGELAVAWSIHTTIETALNQTKLNLRFFELTCSYYRDNMSAWQQKTTFLDLLKAIFLTSSLPVAT